MENKRKKLLKFIILMSALGCCMVVAGFLKGGGQYFKNNRIKSFMGHEIRENFSINETDLEEENVNNDAINSKYGEFFYAENQIPLQEFQDLDVTLNMGELYIVHGNEFMLYISDDLIDQLQWKESRGKLTIKQNKMKKFPTNSEYALIIHIPRNTKLNQIEMNNGLGSIFTDFFRCENLSLNLGTGEFDIHAEVDYLNLKSGIGEVYFNGIINESVDIKGGVGEIYLNLEGNRQDYQIDLKNGLGECYVDNKVWKKEKSVNNRKKSVRSIFVKQGLGGIYINFSE